MILADFFERGNYAEKVTNEGFCFVNHSIFLKLTQTMV